VLVNNLRPLSDAGVSLINICGALDPWIKENTIAAEKNYKEYGGKMKVIIHEGRGHFISDPGDSKKLVDFILQNTSDKK
jgi:hypothetical protein